MLATVLVVWCLGSFLLATRVGRLIRRHRYEPTLVECAGSVPAQAKPRIEVA